MITETVVIPKSTHNILRRLTGQSRPEIALSLAIKDLVRLRMNEALSRITKYEAKYGMAFSDFEEACARGKIQNPFSYEVEKDEREWEAAVTDQAALEEIMQWLA
jgi:hypothetical protein